MCTYMYTNVGCVIVILYCCAMCDLSSVIDNLFTFVLGGPNTEVPLCHCIVNENPGHAYDCA